MIAAERARQMDMDGEGYQAAHDDRHVNSQLAMYAAELACHGTDAFVEGIPYGPDRWGLVYRHAADRVRQLVIAGALIAAEIDRLQRAAESAP